MTTFSPSDAALEGFRLVRERPGAIVAWSGIYFLGVFLIAAVMVLTLGQDVLAFVREGGMEGGDVDKLAAAFEHAWPALILIMLMVAALYAVISGGVYRLVLRPDEPGLAHLRLGADEARLFLVNLVMALLGVGYFVCLGLAVGAIAGRSLTELALGVVAVGLLTWLSARLLLAAPMTFGERRMSIGASWRLTRRHFWPLLGMSILAWVFYVIVWLLLSVIGALFVALAGGGEAMSRPEQLAPTALVAFVVAMFIQLLIPVLQIVTLCAPLAVAYRQIEAEAMEDVGG